MTRIRRHGTADTARSRPMLTREVGPDAATVARIRDDLDIACRTCGYTACPGGHYQPCLRGHEPGEQITIYTPDGPRTVYAAPQSAPAPEADVLPEGWVHAPWKKLQERYQHPGAGVKVWRRSAALRWRAALTGSLKGAYGPAGETREQAMARALSLAVPEPTAPWVRHPARVTTFWDHPSGATVSRDSDGLWDWMPPNGRFSLTLRHPTWQQAAAAALGVSS